MAKSTYTAGAPDMDYLTERQFVAWFRYGTEDFI